jgi:dTDP-4-amino-4,6-dideoxygalactose transaminase
MSRDAWQRYTSEGSWYYEVLEPGYKQNMTDIQAALGIHQLRKLDAFIATRQRYATMYDRALAVIPEVSTPVRRPGRTHTYHLYPIRLDTNRLAIGRDEIIRELSRGNIGTSVHFIPVHVHPFYRDTYGYRRGDFPNAMRIYEELVSLPLYPAMTEEDVACVAGAVRALVEQYRK